MKQIILLITFILTTLTSQAQWVTKVVNNGIDEPYRIAYCQDASKTAVLKLEKVDTSIAFYLSGGYHCDENMLVDIGLVVGTETKRYSFDAFTSGDKRTVFIIDDIKAEEMIDFLNDFKKATKLSIRLNESHCTDDYYQFNMSGSTRALEFISK